MIFAKPEESASSFRAYAPYDTREKEEKLN